MEILGIPNNSRDWRLCPASGRKRLCSWQSIADLRCDEVNLRHLPPPAMASVATNGGPVGGSRSLEFLGIPRISQDFTRIVGFY